MVKNLSSSHSIDMTLLLLDLDSDQLSMGVPLEFLFLRENGDARSPGAHRSTISLLIHFPTPVRYSLSSSVKKAEVQLSGLLMVRAVYD